MLEIRVQRHAVLGGSKHREGGTVVYGSWCRTCEWVGPERSTIREQLDDARIHEEYYLPWRNRNE